MSSDNSAIGFVSSTIGFPADESQFSFIISKNENDCEKCRLNPLDIVKVQVQENEYIYASVVSVQSMTDAPDHVANYISNNFGKGAEPKAMNRIAFYCVSAKVLFNENDNYFPVKNGDNVYLCDNVKELYKIIYSGYSDEDKEKQNYIPIAKQTMYNGGLELCALLDKRYLIGPDAAHLNISGMSGVASKTTKAMAILRELYNRDEDIRIVIFNTKGEDFIDLTEKSIEDLDSIYQELQRFGNRSENSFSPTTLRPMLANKQSKTKNGENFVLKYSIQKKKGNLDLLVVDDADTTGTMDGCTKVIQNWEDKVVKDWDGLKSAVTTQAGKKEKDNTTGIQGISWKKYSRVINRVIDDSGLFVAKGSDIEDLSELLEKKLKDNVANRVLVIDLAALDNNPLQQAYVFGCTMRAIREYCAKDKDNKVAVFVDELNKYASEDTSATSPILMDLIDVAERGRSLGLCLVTAEQSLSIIHRRIKANIANYIYGRTGTLELTQFDYEMIPQVFKQQMTMFLHADGLICTSTLNTGLLKAKFPDKFYEEK